MQQLTPIRTHVVSPSNGSIHRVPGNSTRGTVRLLPLVMAAGVLICTALQLWGWISHGMAAESLSSKTVVSIRAALNPGSSSNNNRRWLQIPAALKAPSTRQNELHPPLSMRTPTHPAAVASGQESGTAMTASSSASIPYKQQEQEQQQEQRQKAAPTPKATTSAPAAAHNSTTITTVNAVLAAAAQAQPQSSRQKHAALRPVQPAAVHSIAKASPPVALLQKQHQDIQAKPEAVTTHTQAVAAAGATGGSSASLLQLTQAYEEALAGLSIALHLSKQKAEEAAALREQLLHVYKAGNASTTTISSSNQAPLQLRQHKQQAAFGQATVEVAPAETSNSQAQAASSGITGVVNRHSKAWCTRKSGKRIRIFIGVYTSFSAPSAKPQYNYAARRAALRASWFPGDAAERARLETHHGVVVRFVIGSSRNATEEAALLQEQREHGDVMKLPLQEHYRFLPNKTRTFFKLVTNEWEPDWVVKIDDDVYLNIPRLLEAGRQWDRMGAEYIGCLKSGIVRTDPGNRWFEPANILVGPTYWLHSYGNIYAVAGTTASCVIGAAFERLRLLANEDTSVGLWMLASNVVYFEDARLCSPVCTKASVAVQRTVCDGLCNPAEDLKLLHANSNCSMPPDGRLLYHKSYPEHAVFEQMWVE